MAAKKVYKKGTEIHLPISKQIDVNFRNYALYVLENRGIPSFYDGLTNVQKFILQNCPVNFTKTVSVIGKCIEAGYHHGDCLDNNTKIRLGDGTQITIGEWHDKYPECKFIVEAYDEENDEFTLSIGHSPRIGQETDEVYDIILENGETFTCTGNHPFFTQRGWVKAEDLTSEDEIIQKP